MSDPTHTLVQVLSDPQAFPWNHALFANAAEIARRDAQCLVLDPNSVESDEDEEPPEAKQLGYSYILSVQDIQGIAKNLRAQTAKATEAQMLKAFLYYVTHDAYIVLGDGQG